MLRRVVVLGGVGLAVFAVLFASSPTAKAYTISNNDADTRSSGGGSINVRADCPTSSILYEIGARGSNSYTSPTRLNGVCVNLTSDVTQRQTSTSTIGGTSSWGSVAGELTLTSTSCANTQAIVGAVVHKQASGFVSGWQLMCGTLPGGTSRTTSGLTFGWANPTRPSPNQPETIQCPDGMVAVGLVAAAGDIIDKFGFRCGRISGATQATVSVTSSSNITFGSTLALTATGGTGTGAISFATTGSCTVSGSTLTPTGNAGATCSVTATRAGDTNYAVQASSVQTVTIQRAANTISFTNPTARSWSATPFDLTVSATSNIIPSMTSTTPSVCSVSGITVTMLSSGTCSLTASQGETTNYDAAVAVVRSFTIDPTGRSAFVGNSANISGTTTGTEYIVERFTTTGASTWTVPQGVTNIDYLVVGGGGGGGAHVGGGGGAGGVRTGSLAVTPSTPSTPSTLNITVGTGGAGARGGTYGDCSETNRSKSGADSTLSTITATGGGSGGTWDYCAARSGGSGGGSGATNTAGSGNTPSTSPSQGNNGGIGSGYIGENYAGGGGGGAASVGAVGQSNRAGNGGTGVQSGITGVMSHYGGGGGGGVHSSTGTGGVAGVAGTGGLGGGGNGTVFSVPNGTAGSGQANTGGGGGGAGYPSGTLGSSIGGAGGSGIVVVRYVLPTVTTPNLIDADDTGTNSDNITSKRTLIFTGSAPITSTVQLSVATASSTSDTDSTTGDWSNNGLSCSTSSTAATISQWSCTTAQLAPGLYKVRSTATTNMDGLTDTQISSTALVVNIDTTSPTIEVTRSSAGTLLVGQTETITFTLSEASSTFAADDITLSGGTISTLTTTSSTVYSVVFTPTSNTDAGTGSISVALSRFTDTAGNNNTASNALSIPYDTTRPSVTMSASPASVSSGSTSTITFTVSESVTTFTSTDVSVLLGTLTSFSGSGRTYTATFTASPSSGGTAVITVASGSITDSNTNANTSAFTLNITVTNAASSSGGRTSYLSDGTNGTNGVRYFVERFTTTGSSTWTVPQGVTTVDVLAIGGGGGAGDNSGGGGSGGGVAFQSNVAVSGTVNISVGTGGAAGTSATDHGKNGLATSFGSVSAGGGNGGRSNSGTGGASVTGSGAGGNGSTSITVLGLPGGDGPSYSITGTPTNYAGGGGGGGWISNTSGGAGGAGGGGAGGGLNGPSGLNGVAGTNGLGGGGGSGSNSASTAGAGGSGIVVVRYSVPAASTPDLDAADDTGTNTDNITSSTTLTFTGSAPVGSTVQLFVDGVSSGNTCTANSTTGAWTCDTAVLTAGDRVITAQSTTILSDSTVTSTSSSLTVTIDTTVPTVSSVSFSSNSGSDDTYKTGDVVSVTVAFSENVNVTNSPRIALAGLTSKSATYASGSGTSSLVFTYTVLSGDNDADGLAIAANTLLLNSGTIRDTAANNATLTHSAVTAQSTHKVEAVAPTVDISRAGTGTLRSGQTDTITFTLSEASSDFAADDITVIGGSIGTLTTTSSTVYSAVFTPTTNTQSGSGSISVTAAKFTDAPGNENTASTSLPIPYDTAAPTVLLARSGSGSLRSGQTSTITFTLSEASSTFAVGDITVTGGSIGALTTTSSTVYSVVFTPTSNTDSGTGSISVDGAAFTDTVGNVNTASTALTISYDTSSPTIEVTRSGAGTLLVGQTETITFTLSEASSTFADGDITLSGGTISALTTTSSTVYSAVFTPNINTNAGTGSISVALSRFTDTAGNNNTASNALSISYDTSRPSVTMSASPASVSSGSTSTITFTVSESVTTFTSADVSARLGTLTNFSGSGTSYNATFTASPTAGGTAVITVASGSITDSNTNANTSAFTFEITVTNTATSSGGRTSYVGNGSNGTNGVRYIVERFTSASTTTWTVPRGISSIDYLVVGGGAGGGSRHAGGGGAGGLRSSVASTGGGASPESAMTVTPGGSLTVTVGAGGASWANGSDSVLGSVTSKGGGTQTTTGGSGGGSNWNGAAGTGTANQGFSGGRGGGNDGDPNWLYAGGGGGGAGAAGSNVGYSGGTAFGGAGGAGVTNSISGVAVCFAGGGGGGYSNNATNGGADNFTIQGGKCGSTMVGGTSPRGANATAGATNTGSGGGGGGFDGGAGNYSGGAGGSGIVVVRYAVPDVTTPDLDASDDTGTNTDNITTATTLTFTGSAPVGSTVQLFVDGVSSGNTCATNSTTGAWTCDTATLAAGNKVITAQSTTLLPDSTVTSTSSGLNVTIDTTVPTIQVTRSGSGALTAGQTETITFTLSEASSTFAADDITLSGGTISALTTTSSTVYSVLFTPTANTQSGTASISVALSRFSDMAGNNNTVSNTVSFTYDTARPTVSLSGCASSYAAGSTCSITITLSDAVTDLLLADFNVTRGSLSGLTTSGTTRTVTYTASGPTGGTASVSLAAGAFTDANGNTSTASNTLNVDIAASNTRQMMTSLSASGVSVADNTNGASRYIVQTFAATGSTTWTPPQGVTRVDLLVVGGGGGGGSRGAGAGGAGGYIEASNFAVTPGSSYTVVTGAGGAGGVVANNDSGAAGSASSFTLSSVGLTANGGGAGLSHSFNGNGGASGTGSGAGGTAFNNAGGNGAASGTCGSTSDWCGGGGGGAGSAGVNAVTTGGNGGNGRASSISGISTTYAGGGGGGGGDSSQPSTSPSPGGTGGSGGGGNGGSPTWDGTNCRAGAGISGTTNTGGGGGGGSYCSSNVVGSFNGGGGSGGSGIVVVRYVLPATTTPDLVIGSDNGTSTTDNITSNRTLTFDGTAPATASVQLSVATATSATDTNASTGTWTDTGSACTADTTSGAWTCTTAELAPGLYKVRSKATTTMDGITDTQTSSTALVVEIDTTAPTVSSVSFTSSSGSDGTYKSGDVISLTVAFSENVAVTNSPRIALAGLSSKFATYASGSGTASLVFTYTVTSGDNDADGLAIAADSLELNSGTIRDSAANNATLAHSAVSTASAQKVDTTAPTVTIARAGSGSLKSGQTEMITFTLSEASSDFVVGDITVAGGSIGTLTTTSSTVYSVVFTPTANTQSGTGSLSVSGTKFTDTAGNNNTASDTLSITYDTAAPTVTVTRTGSTNLRSSQTATITFTLSEASSTFAASDITVAGGSIGTLTTTSSTVYSVVFTPTANTQSGTGSISVAGATFTDTIGNDNTASTALSISYDTAAPTVTITRAGSGSLKSGQTDTLTFTLSETSANFVTSDVTVTGGAIGTLSGSGTSYTATFTPTSNTQTGTGSISVDGAKFTDTIGNDNTASTALSISYDTAAPTVTITRAGSGSLKSGQTDTITFALSEASSDFVVDDITVAGGSIGTLSTTSSTEYSVVFTPTANTQSGNGSISVAGATFADAIGNNNAASTALSISYDTAGPTISIARSGSGSLKSTQTSTITFTLSEASSTFAAEDITVAGGSIGTLTSTSSTVYSVVFTPTANTQSGTGSISVNGAKFTDTIGNDNTASTALSISYDTAAPTVTIARAGSGSLKSGQTETLTFTLSETSSTFVTSDVTVTGGAIGSLSGSGTSYTATFTPTSNTQSGTGSISVDGAKFTDTIGNDNTASTALSINYDTAAPTVSNVTSSTANGTIGIGSTVSIQIAFSEAVTVSGTPQLTLETGATDRVASYASGSGTDTLTFTYTVQSGDTSSDLEYTSTSALALNGGTIVDSVANAATLTLPTPGATGSLAINSAIVVASAPTQVVSVRTPLGPASGAAFSQQPRVSLQDTGGSVVTSDSSTVVTATVSSGASLVGSVTATAVNGVVTFNDLGISGTAGTVYTITYSATVSGNALTAATQSVTPTVGAATQISVSTQPVGDTAGALLATAPVISVLDSGNNVVTSASTSITVSSSGGTLNGTKTVSATNGLATFGDLTFAGTAGTNYTLTFTTASLGSATSNNFSVGVGAATKLAITTQASGAAYNEAFTTQPVIEIRDAGNNKVPSAANVVTATLSNGTVLGSNNTSLNATSSSGVATFSGLGITGLPGSYTITYSSGALVDTSHSISLVKAAQTITFADPTDRAWSATSFALTPTASSGLSVSLASTTTSICTVSGLDVTMVTVGTCSLTATQSGNDYFNAATAVSHGFDISQASQTVSFSDPADRPWSATTFDVAPTATSGLSTTVASTTSAVCTVSGTTITMVKAGTCTLTASQAGNTEYSAATTATQSFVIELATQSTFSLTSTTATFGANLTLTTTGGSGSGSVTFTKVSGDCSITNTTLTPTTASTCVVTATKTADAQYDSTSDTQTVTINRAAQSTPLTLATTTVVYGQTLTLSGSGGEGTGTISYAVSSGTCTLNGAVLTPGDAGSLCEVEVTRALSTNYNSFTSAPISITIQQATPTLGTLVLATKTYGDAPFAFSAPSATYNSASVAGSWSYASAQTSVATINGDTATITGGGTSSITATFSPTDSTNYTTATTASTLTVDKAVPTFSWSNVDATYNDADITIVSPAVATTAATGTWTYSSADTSVVTVSGTKFDVGNAGSAVITATFTPSNTTNYVSGETTTMTFTVGRANQASLGISSVTGTYGTALTLATSGGTTNGSVTWGVSNGSASDCSVTGGQLTTTSIGTCTVTAVMAGSSNYFSVSNVGTTVTINAKPITVTATAKFKTYGDNDPALTFTTPNGALVGNDSLTGALTRVAGDTVGEYTITQGTVTNTNNTNYDITYVTAKLTINAKPITVTATAKFKTYGDNDPDLTFTTAAGALVGNDSLTGALTRVAGDTVGEYTINQGSVDNSNYDITYVTAKLTINEKPITVTAEAKFKTYGDNDPALTFTTAAGALVGNDTLAGALTRVAGQDVGEYTITQGTVTNTNNTNYDLTYVTAKLTINAKPITVTAEAKFKTYGDNDPALTFTTAAGALVGNDTLAGALTRVAGQDVGEYTITQGTVTNTNNTNYDLTYTSAKLTINSKPITVTATAKFKTYGDNDPALTFTTPNGALVGNDSLAGSLTRVAGNTVGEYTINQGTVTNANNTNYNITYTTAKLTINAKPITVTAEAKFKTYGDNDPSLTFTTPNGALVGNDTLAGALTRVLGQDVGEYTINQGTVTNANNTNYNITYTSAKLTINTKPITVTAEPKFKTYGDNDPALTFTTPNGALVGNDTLAGSLTRVLGQDVGEYTINQGTVTNTNNTNYDLTYNSAKMTINAKPITVTATAKFKTYGDNDPALTFTTATGALVGNDTLAGSLTRDAGNTVGEYTINQGTVTNTNNTNYDLTYVTAKLTINAKPITVTATAKFKTYGDNDPALTFTTPNGALVGNDTLAGALTRVAGQDVGEYTINQGTVTNTNNTNYDLTYVTAKLTINEKPITVTAEPKFKTYGDNDPALTFTTATGALVGNDTLAGALTRVLGQDVGEYTIIQGSVDNSNYDISYTSAKLTINTKPITVTAEAKFKTYGDNDPALTFTTPNGALVGNDTLAGALTRVAGDTVGEYTINQGTVTNTSNTNYDITYTSAKLTINAKPITVTAEPKTKIYNTNDPVLTYTTPVGALVGNDTLSGAIARVSGEQVASYPIRIGTLNNPNYLITFVDSALSITPAQQSQLTVTTATITYQTPVSLQATGGTEGDLSFSVVTSGSAGCSIQNSQLSASGNAGSTCTVKATRAATTNFSQIDSATATITVTRRAITVTGTAEEKIYGDADPGFRFSVTAGSLHGSESLTGSLVRATGENAGTYTINQGSLIDTNNPNYTITYVSSQLTVIPRPITITATNKTKIFGQPDPALEYTVTTGNIVPSDVIAGEITRAVGETLGNYNITRGTLVNNNYNITFVTGIFQITGAPQAGFTLTASSYSVVYQQTITVQTSGGNGQGAVSYSTQNGTGSCSVAGTTVTGTTTGTCTVTATKAAEGGYLEAISNSITVTIEKADQTITFASITDHNYSPTPMAMTPTASSGAAVSIGTRTPNVCSTENLAVQMLDSGMCTIAAEVASSRNFNAAPTVTRSFEIRAVAPFAPTITAVEPGDTTVSVVFTPGLSGGAAITTYRYSVDDGGRWTDLPSGTTSSPIILGNLPNTVEAKVRIMAVNRVGNGARSNMRAATPVAKRSLEWEVQRNTVSGTQSPNSATSVQQASQLPPAPARVTVQSMSGGRRTQVTAVRAAKDANIPVTYALISVRTRTNKLLARIKVLVDPTNPTTSVSVPYASSRVRVSVQFANDMGISSGGPAGINIAEGNTLEWTTVSNEARIKGTEVKGDLVFERGKSTLTYAMQQNLKKMAATVNARGGLIYVSGFAQKGELKSAWMLEPLARARAEAVAKYLAKIGVRQWITFHGSTSAAMKGWQPVTGRQVVITTVMPNEI
jgi:large repetitive protein